MNENLCIALITTASIFAGFLVAFLSSYLTTRNRENDENRRAFDALGRKLTLFRQLCGFVWSSNCLNEQRRKLKANEPAFEEDGYVKSFMHAIDALHKDLKLNQYKQNPYIDYREVDLDKMKTLVNSIWYDLIHKNYEEIHFSQPLDCPFGISQGYFATIRKELSFGNKFASEGMDDREFGTIAGNVECEVMEDMEVLQYKMHKSIDCDVVAIVRYTMIVFVSGVVIPLLLLWAKDCLTKIGCWNNLILLLVMAVFLYSIVMAAKHTYNYFQKQESSKVKQMVSKSKHEEKLDEIKKHEDAFREFYNKSKEIFNGLQEADPSSRVFKDRCMLQVCPGSRAGGNNPDVVDVFWGTQPVKRIDKRNGFELLTEDGVTMLFNLLPDGHVSITLYPAKTKVMRPIEDCVLFHRFCKATWLLKERNQKALWRDFMAYTECTSLIGTPTIWQRLRMFWVKYSRPVCIDGVQQPIRGLQHLRKVVTFALTVGLSGFLLVGVQQCHKEEPIDYSPLIEKTNTTIEGVQKTQSEILKETQSVNANIDSLIKQTSHLNTNRLSKKK